VPFWQPRKDLPQSTQRKFSHQDAKSQRNQLREEKNSSLGVFVAKKEYPVFSCNLHRFIIYKIVVGGSFIGGATRLRQGYAEASIS